MSEPNRELADFLRRARAQIDPARAGLLADNRVRRVPGLRREEVARLAGVSADYYTRLEQGRRITPSVGVVDAIARALDLDAAGREYLGQLIGRPSGIARRSVPVQRVRPGLYQLLDSLGAVPALVLGRRADVLASNWMAHALFTDFAALPARERNYVRWMFLGSEPRELFLDWETQARAAVESLRLDVGNNPEDRAGLALVEELSAAAGEFRQWWAEHQVLQRTHGSKRLRHPVTGELTVEYETLTLPGDSDQTLYLYTTEPGSPSQQALRMLASWSVPGGTATLP
ncbi:MULTISPECIES: helix-turn-helix transcriptional regulator [Nocardia]|uniref:helix-turn-helix transcriptional regulator n=1 Tax=Nocardia TaxID=1817 RepID=UPI0007EAEE85|nr:MULTISPECIES: helix-turn-helix transcriptional regulator [Nocardia]MBF6275801.1 helix-turn-helix domain-containing protein [Nocardia nova]OBA40666.1 transcriptional regulator [Nocardia sp. 852002-51101_SCH5132738]OBB50018.1 transcriptional regulator [Nocardia sp. 852002-51244_SCH5132740]OBF82042.1 transcriptional regulator [Mycobacterium sp. 852002-51759_SCH5129042]